MGSNRNSTMEKDTSTSQFSPSTSSGPASICSNSFATFRQDDYKKYLKLPIEHRQLIKLILFDDCRAQSFDQLPLGNYSDQVKLGRFTLKLLLAKMEYDINKRVRRHFKKKKSLLKLDKNIKLNEQPWSKQAPAASLGQDTILFAEEVVYRNSKFPRVSFKV